MTKKELIEESKRMNVLANIFEIHDKYIAKFDDDENSINNRNINKHIKRMCVLYKIHMCDILVYKSRYRNI